MQHYATPHSSPSLSIPHCIAPHRSTTSRISCRNTSRLSAALNDATLRPSAFCCAPPRDSTPLAATPRHAPFLYSRTLSRRDSARLTVLHLSFAHCMTAQCNAARLSLALRSVSQRNVPNDLLPQLRAPQVASASRHATQLNASLIHSRDNTWLALFFWNGTITNNFLNIN